MVNVLDRDEFLDVVFVPLFFFKFSTIYEYMYFGLNFCGNLFISLNVEKYIRIYLLNFSPLAFPSFGAIDLES